MSPGKATSRRSRIRLWWPLIFAGGVALSMIVAWACALWSPMKHHSGKPINVGPDHELAAPLQQFGRFDRFGYTLSAGFGWKRELVFAASTQASTAVLTRLKRIRAGWPLPCMEGEIRTVAGQSTEYALARLPEWPGVDGNGLGWIPLRPLWGGLLLNSLILLLPVHVVIAVFAARRALRKRRGLCSRCGYDLRAAREPDTPCPECGSRP